jgi:hypothetical protein
LDFKQLLIQESINSALFSIICFIFGLVFLL